MSLEPSQYFKLGMMIETSKFSVLIVVWMKLTYVQGHCCMRNQKLFCIFFLTNFSISLDEIDYATTTSWLVEAF